MAELIQHILSLPQNQQLAIVQAIVANIQVHSTTTLEGSADVNEAQLQRIESIIEAHNAGKIPSYTEDEFWQHIEKVKETRKNG